MPVRVMIVDDHGVVRAGLRALLQPEADMAIVGEASGVKEAVRKAMDLTPDIVLMDITLKDGSGIEATRLIKQSCPNTQVLMLTIYGDQETALQAVKAGAIGYLLATDGTAIHPVIARKMVERLAQNEHEAVLQSFRRGPGLTEREIEVLREVTQGLGDKEIAAKLHLSEPTIKSHLRSIYQKLRVRNRAQAATYAVKNGLEV
jgi:DNA-binding NarL/FixJ family response regulator